MPQMTIQQMADLNTGIKALNDNVTKMAGELSQANDRDPAYFENMTKASRGMSTIGTQFQSITGAGGHGNASTALDVSSKAAAGLAALGHIIPGVGTVLAGFSATVAGATAAYNLTIGSLSSWSDSLRSSREHLRNYSSGMASAFAQSDVRDIQRNIRESSMTADSTRDLLESRAALRDAFLPLEAAMINVTNTMMMGANKAAVGALSVTEGLLRMIPGMGDIIDKMRKKMDEDKGKPSNVGVFMGHMIKDVKKRRVNRRPGYRR